MTPFGLKMKTMRFFLGVPLEAAQPRLGKLNKKFAAAALTPVFLRKSLRLVMGRMARNLRVWDCVSGAENAVKGGSVAGLMGFERLLLRSQRPSLGYYIGR